MKQIRKIPSINIPIQKADGSLEWVWYMFLQWLADQQNTPYEAGVGIEIANNKINNTGVLGVKVNNTSLVKDSDGNVNVSVTTGTQNGTISVNEEDVAVKGLGSAAYTESSDYDASGAAATAEQNAKNYADGLVLNYAEKDFSNITGVAKNIANWSSNATNCATYIQQDIKLTLSNGTLTLNAGSKVYVPNGFEQDGTTRHFDEVIIQNNLNCNVGSSSWTNGEHFVCIRLNGTSNVAYYKEDCFSGNTAPTSKQYELWYDTANNVIKYSSDSGSTWSSSKWSFPICIALNTSGNCSGIRRIFDGLGYIGTAWFMLSGVKGLVSNGLNDDGTCKNIEFTNPSVYVYTPAASAKRTVGVELDASGNITNVMNGQAKNLHFGTILPTTVPDTLAHYYYKTDENQWYKTGGSTTASWSKCYPFYVGTRTDDGTFTSEFTVRTVFRALDYNNLVFLLNVIYPIGAIYIGTTSYCPMAALFGTWELIQGRYLLASGTLAGTSETYSATNTVASGLPNDSGWISGMSEQFATYGYTSGAFNKEANITTDGPTFSGSGKSGVVSLYANRSSSVYSQSAAVRAPAYVVNVWRRTA